MARCYLSSSKVMFSDSDAFLGIYACPTVMELGLLALKLLQQVYGITMPAANFRAMTNVLHVTFLLRKITERLWAGLLMARHQG